ncbi:MarR family winged helix-turn-helix transcriptional regulator [Corynebacterium sp. A21]|uniref:MarR family winged helix-turn-helix transcriptional regulator n=1 Tax=Corynebacterium sp. A21 TaxID=3457318 RepID=UPI003FD48FBE
MTISESHRDLATVNYITSSPGSESLVTVLVHTTKVFSAMVAECVSRQGFTLDEWMVLDSIEHNNGSSMSQISAASGCSGASLTRAVDKLVTNSLVYREASQTDRRKVEVFISEQGKAAHRSIQNHLGTLELSVEELIGSSDINRSALIELLGAFQTVTVDPAAGR